jgi:formylglycine-generating enzyme required for sulfatase activity
MFALFSSTGRGQSATALAAPAAAAVEAPKATPEPAPPLTAAQKAILQGPLSKFVSDLAASTGIQLVPIPAGTFTMGSDNRVSGPPRDAHIRQTTLEVTWVKLTKDFLLGSTLVTQGEYEAVTGKNPSFFTKAGKNAPVECVSWGEAQNFCDRLTERERSAGRLPVGHAFTLPTEAQWDYASRAEVGPPLETNKETVDAMGWHEYNSGQSTHPVASKPPNAWGLYDMHGNVWEWCEDGFQSQFPGGAVIDPILGAGSDERVIRGGSWSNRWWDVGDYELRMPMQGGTRNGNLGFRVALISIAP